MWNVYTALHALPLLPGVGREISCAHCPAGSETLANESCWNLLNIVSDWAEKYGKIKRMIHTACPSKHTTMFFLVFFSRKCLQSWISWFDSDQCLHGTTRLYDQHYLPNGMLTTAQSSRSWVNVSQTDSWLKTKALAKSCEVSSRHSIDSEWACPFWIQNMHWLRALKDRFHLSQLIGLEMSKTLKKGGTNPGNLSQTLENAQKKHVTCNDLDV